ncbi:unnamed protein product [Eruca vesicaria subsp. sativa]|uniref:NPH3 domain-containing protein n=1 Tax=Eruca vesicaria subsp. sativa TaxID=29727 RepID=A0ABC8KJN3_ERUVS|nr:unnamed protein product [Eruca vesicaria subsp. sativa]
MWLTTMAASTEGRCLSVDTFKALGEITVAASCDVLRYSDGIYRAVDVFLERRHRDLTETEKMDVCRVLDCKKLSPEACEHASKNEKLPLRIVVQVLFFAQKQIHEKVARDMKSVKEKDDGDDDIEDMNKKLLRLDIESDYREIENLECVVHCSKKNKEEKKISVWREVKRKFGCMTSLTVDACNFQIKKRKKTYHHY